MILLAPMEGVVDPVVRELICAQGGVDFCTTEFVRVTSTLLPAKIFHKYCPELRHMSRTANGTPVFLQILGSDLTTMPENAQLACELGAYGIDINFGCPAPTVNRHDGGAALLKTPERVFQIASRVRKAVPSAKPVTAKVRLGFSDQSLSLDIAQAAESAGMTWLTVHARTKMDGYRPPAYWESLAPIHQNLKIPVIANGEIWSAEDAQRCRDISSCESIMIGRGLVAQPDLALQIKEKVSPMSWHQRQKYLLSFAQMSLNYAGERYAVQRCKQMVKLFMRNSKHCTPLFESIKREAQLDAICEKIKSTSDFIFSSPILPSLKQKDTSLALQELER